MVEFMGVPDGMNVRIGHNIFDRNTGEYFQVVGRKTIDVTISETLTANQSQKPLQLSELKSSESEMYWIDEVILLNNIRFWMKYREKDLFGTSTRTGLTLMESNVIKPFKLNTWTFNFTPHAEMSELSGIEGTKQVRFTGLSFSVQKYNVNSEEGRKAIQSIKDKREKCWEIRG